MLSRNITEFNMIPRIKMEKKGTMRTKFASGYKSALIGL
jgi:hypothetical protein